MLALGAAMAGCVPGTNADDVDAGVLGIATASLSSVPPGIGCVRVVVQGSFTSDQHFTVTPGKPTTLTMTGLPLGVATFTGLAYDRSCSAVSNAVIPAWVSDSQSMVLSAGVLVNVSLLLRQNGGGANVGINFADGGVGFFPSSDGGLF